MDALVSARTRKTKTPSAVYVVFRALETLRMRGSRHAGHIRRGRPIMHVLRVYAPAEPITMEKIIMIVNNENNCSKNNDSTCESCDDANAQDPNRCQSTQCKTRAACNTQSIPSDLVFGSDVSRKLRLLKPNLRMMCSSKAAATSTVAKISHTSKTRPRTKLETGATHEHKPCPLSSSPWGVLFQKSHFAFE